MLSVLIENMAELRDLDVEVGFLDDPPGPDGLHDRAFRDEPPRRSSKKESSVIAREPSATATPP
jgi:hypothetical protein